MNTTYLNIVRICVYNSTQQPINQINSNSRKIGFIKLCLIPVLINSINFVFAQDLNITNDSKGNFKSNIIDSQNASSFYIANLSPNGKMLYIKNDSINGLYDLEKEKWDINFSHSPNASLVESNEYISFNSTSEIFFKIIYNYIMPICCGIIIQYSHYCKTLIF